MIPLSLSEVASATHGTVVGPEGQQTAGAEQVMVTSGVVTDSREATPGALFVARAGEHADGHRFVPGAVENGAVAAVTRHAVPDIPSVVVEDPEKALGQVARAVLDRCEGLAVVGITGSSGKTTTKDMLGQVLSQAGSTIAPIGSYNSEVGLPLTVCRLTESTRFLVAEMGASGVGHIAYLTKIAPPRVAIVLNVGSAHLGEFGSREAVGRAKRELVEALDADGLAVLNADDPVVSAMASVAPCPVVTVGRGSEADLRATDVTLDRAGRASFTVSGAAGTAQVRLAVSGEHMVGNALAVIAAATHLGMALDDVAHALATAGPKSRWRMEVHDPAPGVTLINDAYNANPESMRAAVAALAAMGEGATTYAVLGQMLELGDDSEREHRAVGEAAAQAGISRLVAVGPGAGQIAQGWRDVRGEGCDVVFDSVNDGETYLRTVIDGEDSERVILLKSSRDSGLRYLGDRLCGIEAPPAC